MEILKPALNGQLTLTTADLRFMDGILKAVDSDWDDVGGVNGWASQ